jgi:hypothetical protein
MIDVKNQRSSPAGKPDERPARTTVYRQMLEKLGADGDDPLWSSFVLDEMLKNVPAGSVGSFLQAFMEILGENGGELTVPLANIIRDVVVATFTREQAAYRCIDWGRFDRALATAPTKAQLYFALHAIPPENLSPRLISDILAGLEASAFRDEAHRLLDV